MGGHRQIHWVNFMGHESDTVGLTMPHGVFVHDGDDSTWSPLSPAKGEGVAHAQGKAEHGPNRAAVNSSTGIPPPDQGVQLRPESSHPAGYGRRPGTARRIRLLPVTIGGIRTTR